MKIMQLLSSLYHDDDERGIFQLNRSLIKQSHESVIVCTTPSDNELALRLQRDGAIYIPLFMEKHSWMSLLSVFALAKLIKKHRPDIVHIHSRTCAWLLKWALHLIPVVYRPITLATIYGYYPITVYNKAIFDADHLISVSDSVTDYIKRYHDEYDDSMITRIYRGVNTRKFIYRHQPSVHWLRQIFAEYPLLEHKKWVVFPSTLDYGKGQRWLFDIVGNLKESLPNIHVIIMDDEQRESLYIEEFIQRSHALGLEKYFTFIGKRYHDNREWLSAANVVLGLANQPESIGINLLKAVHLATPVVAWNQGIYSELLVELFPQGLVKQNTANALCKVVKAQLKNVARPQMSNAFTQRQMISQTIELYETLLIVADSMKTECNHMTKSKKQLCKR